MVDFAEQDILFLEGSAGAPFLALAIGDVDDGGQHHGPLVGLDRVQADLDRQFGGILPQAVKIAPRPHRPGGRRRTAPAAGTGTNLLPDSRYQPGIIHPLSVYYPYTRPWSSPRFSLHVVKVLTANGVSRAAARVMRQT